MEVSGSTESYLRLGEAQRAAGDLNSAIASFTKAKEISPSDPVPPLELGMLLDTSGRKDEARKAYEEVIKLAPDNPTALNNLAYSKADDGIDLDQALTYAERARLKQPNNPDILDTVALIYIRKNLTDDSLRLLKELVAQKPSSPTIRLHYAMALYQKGNRVEAKKELEEAQKRKPNEKEQLRIKELMAKVG